MRFTIGIQALIALILVTTAQTTFAASIGAGIGASYFMLPSTDHIQKTDPSLQETYHQTQPTFTLQVQFALSGKWFLETSFSRLGDFHASYKGQNDDQSIKIDSYQTLTTVESAFGYAVAFNRSTSAYWKIGAAISETRYQFTQKTSTETTRQKQDDSLYSYQYIPTPVTGIGVLHKYNDLITLKFAYEYTHLTGDSSEIDSFRIVNSTKKPQAEGLRTQRLVAYILFETY